MRLNERDFVRIMVHRAPSNWSRSRKRCPSPIQFVGAPIVTEWVPSADWVLLEHCDVPHVHWLPSIQQLAWPVVSSPS